MMAHPLALQLRNLQSLVEIGVDKNTTVVFPAPLMSTIGELGSFLARETAASNGGGDRGAGDGRERQHAGPSAGRRKLRPAGAGPPTTMGGRCALDVAPSADTCEVVRAPTYGSRPMTDPTPNRPGESTFRLMYRSRNLVPQDQRKLRPAGHRSARRGRTTRSKASPARCCCRRTGSCRCSRARRTPSGRSSPASSATPRHDSVTVLETGRVPGRVFARWAMARVAEHGEPDIPLIAHTDGISPAAARGTTPEQDHVLDVMRSAALAAGPVASG